MASGDAGFKKGGSSSTGWSIGAPPGSAMADLVISARSPPLRAPVRATRGGGAAPAPGGAPGGAPARAAGGGGAAGGEGGGGGASAAEVGAPTAPRLACRSASNRSTLLGSSSPVATLSQS